MAANVSVEALGISESGSSNRSSIQVPPLTGVPPVEDVGVVVVGVPPVLQALSSMSTTARAEKDSMRKRGRGFLNIVPSLRNMSSAYSTRELTFFFRSEARGKTLWSVEYAWNMCRTLRRAPTREPPRHVLTLLLFCLGKLPQQVDAASIEVGELLAFSYLDRALCEMPRIMVLSLLLSKACLVEERVGEKIVISHRLDE